MNLVKISEYQNPTKGQNISEFECNSPLSNQYKTESSIKISANKNPLIYFQSGETMKNPVDQDISQKAKTKKKIDKRLERLTRPTFSSNKKSGKKLRNSNNKSTNKKVVKRKSFSTQKKNILNTKCKSCLLYTSPSPRDGLLSRMPSSA